MGGEKRVANRCPSLKLARHCMLCHSVHLSSNWHQFPFLDPVFPFPSCQLKMLLFLFPLLRNPINFSLFLHLSAFYLSVKLFSFSVPKREMGRGRIEIKKIENPTNRQVTYSKRRLGIMKKAKELTVLCDAEVLVIMSSTTGKLAEYCSPSTDTKRIMDRYQQVTGVDLWKDQHEKMQNTLRNLQEVNRSLRREIRQRMGEELNGLCVKELRGLEQSLDETLMNVRQRKYHVITTQTETYKKKVKSTHEAHKILLHELEMKDEHQDYGFVTEDDIECAPMFAFRVQPSQLNLLGLGYGHDLRLA